MTSMSCVDSIVQSFKKNLVIRIVQVTFSKQSEAIDLGEQGEAGTSERWKAFEEGTSE